MLELCEAWYHHMMHPGVKKQVLDMQRRFEIDQIGLYSAIKKVRKGCSVCQACNPDNPNVKGEAQWTPVPDQPMERVAMDVFSMPKVHIGKETFDCVVLCVDRHSGYVVAVLARKKGLLAKEVAVMMIRHWLTVFDIPRTICSDRGRQSTGGWFKAMCSCMGIHHAKSVAYLSLSNGRAEVAGRQLFEKLRKIHITNQRRNSFEEMWPALKAHHDTPTPGGLSPHQILFGRNPLGRGPPLSGDGMAMDAKESFAWPHAHAGRERAGDTKGARVEYRRPPPRRGAGRPRRDTPPPAPPPARGPLGPRPPPPEAGGMVPPPPERGAGARPAPPPQPPAPTGAAKNRRARAYAPGRRTDRTQRSLVSTNRSGMGGRAPHGQDNASDTRFVACPGKAEGRNEAEQPPALQAPPRPHNRGVWRTPPPPPPPARPPTHERHRPAPRRAAPTGRAGRGDRAGPPHPHARAHNTWIAGPDSPPSGRAVGGGGAHDPRRPSQR